jgi:hypothetical protein
VFSGNVLSEKAQKLLNAMREAEADGLNKTQMYELFGRKVKKQELESLLSEIESAGAAYSVKRNTAGRDEERWIVVSEDIPSNELREEDEEGHYHKDVSSSNSHNSPSKEAIAEAEMISHFTAIRLPAPELFN